MRTFGHWTPTYVRDRLRTLLYERSDPYAPWLTREANEILACLLRSSDAGLEFGSGRSTRWFASRVRQLTSVEHDEGWYEKVKQTLRANGIENVDYRLRARDRGEAGAADSGYPKVAEEFEPQSLDFCLVDGLYRDFCAFNVLDKLRPGGFLVIDNVNWFLPSPSRSPASRMADQAPSTEVWTEVNDRLRSWRRIWTSSGVTDTAIFFRPC